MELLIELILELVLDGCIEVSKNKKVPKPIRYLLIMFLSIFFMAVIGIIFFSGILMLKYQIIVGIMIILIGMLMLILAIIKFRKINISSLILIIKKKPLPI